MRIKIVRPVKAYFNYEVRVFAPGDEVDGELAEIVAGNNPDGTVEILEGELPKPKLATVPAVVVPDGGTQPEPGADLDITAKVDVVLAWVGDDPARAAQALEAENAKDKPRSTLVKTLEELAAREEDPEDDDEAEDDEDDEDEDSETE
jgi:hypothetical protein